MLKFIFLLSLEQCAKVIRAWVLKTWNTILSRVKRWSKRVKMVYFWHNGSGHVSKKLLMHDDKKRDKRRLWISVMLIIRHHYYLVVFTIINYKQNTLSVLHLAPPMLTNVANYSPNCKYLAKFFVLGIVNITLGLEAS